MAPPPCFWGFCARSWPNVLGARSRLYSREPVGVDTADVGLRATHQFARVALLAAAVVLGLPQAAAGTVYDELTYEQLVADGATPKVARCSSALPGARVTLERYVDGYFVAMVFEDPKAHTQETADDGGYSWEVGEGEYRVSVTKNGYWRAFSGIVTGPATVADLDVALRRRPGTPPPAPRDCSHLEQPAPEPEPDREPQGSDAEPDPAPEPNTTCLLRPVNARVSGRLVTKVVYLLDNRRLATISRPDDEGRYGVTVERTSLSRGLHVLRAKVVFVRSAQREPEFLRLAIRRCPERMASRIAKASTGGGCVKRPFNAWVRATQVRRVFFRLNGRRLRTVTAADWRGRYGVTVRPSRLRKGKHVIKARIEFLRGAELEQRTVRFRFRNCA